MLAFLKLADHAATCKQEVIESAVELAIGCVRIDSGLTPAAKTEILTMCTALLFEPECSLPYVRQHRMASTAQHLIDSDIVDVLLPYCVEPEACGVSKDLHFLKLCTELLRHCIKHGQDFHRGCRPDCITDHRAEFEAALEHAKKAGYCQTLLASGDSACTVDL